MIVLIFFAFHWYTSLFIQSFFHHRYAAHRQFTMSPVWEKFFYVCSFLTQGSSYISPYAYGVMHRLHHMHTDTMHDPHSPVISPGFFTLLWNTRNYYYSTYSGKTSVEDKVKKDIPNWHAFDAVAHNWISRMGWIVGYTLFYVFFATNWWLFLLLPLTVIMASLQGAIVNWWAHKFGYVTYVMKNESKNILPVDLFFMGEAYHNNHHKYPGRLKNAHRWFEIDPTYCFIWCMNKLKIIRTDRTTY